MSKKVNQAGLIAVTVLSATLALSACQSTSPDVTDLAGSTDSMMPDMADMDLDSAAEKLGVSTDDLTDALGSPVDVAGAAEKLGISKEALMEALGV